MISSLNKSCFFLFLGSLVLLFSTQIASAQSGNWGNNNLVIGAGLIEHNYSSVDDHRKGDSSLGVDEIKSGSGPELMIEYLISNFFVGFNYQDVDAQQDISGNGWILNRQVKLTSNIIYFGYLFGFTDTLGLGGRAGIGNATYKTDMLLCFTALDYCIEENGSSSGTVSLLGLFMDWGGQGFGLRLGIQKLSGSFSDINNSSVRANGTQYALDLRWGF